MCGQSIITEEAMYEIQTELSDRERVDLASWVRERSVHGYMPPTICSSSFEGSDSAEDYRINQILETLIPRDISELLDRVLENLGCIAKEPGEYCTLDAYDIYVCYARSPQQMCFHLDALQESGWLREVADGWSTMMINPSGWKRIGELQAVGGKSHQAFVAMSFSDELKPAWEDGLSKGIDAAGYSPLRVDKKEHNEKICDRIISEIRRSGLLVADVTGHRQGVYFEAGYAMGLGIPVIWTCRKDQMGECHFDTRQYNHIVWETPEELAKALEHRIRATIGEPPK
jgi:nucleoside 2-deoxyribosyltransferase